jgi:hypothetical protein
MCCRSLTTIARYTLRWLRRLDSAVGMDGLRHGGRRLHRGLHRHRHLLCSWRRLTLSLSDGLCGLHVRCIRLGTVARVNLRRLYLPDRHLLLRPLTAVLGRSHRLRSHTTTAVRLFVRGLYSACGRRLAVSSSGCTLVIAIVKQRLRRSDYVLHNLRRSGGDGAVTATIHNRVRR